MNNRKTAKRLLLINWSRFQYEDIRLGGSTLFTGVNGSGKSTVLDAITYLLTGNTQFNIAAKDKDRNVKSYVRGDTKARGANQYLRGQGEIISYIAMEFDSPEENSTFVIAVGIESPNPNDATSSWLIAKDATIDDINFAEKIADGKCSVTPVKGLAIKGKRIKSSSDLMGRDKAKVAIIRALGMRCDATLYRKKLLKMMSFDPENDINKFIAESVLEANPIKSLDQLREQKESFEKIRQMYEGLLECKRALETLEKVTAAYEEKQENYRIREFMLDIQSLKQVEHTLSSLETKQEEKVLELQTAKDKSQAAREAFEAAQERYNAIMSNGDFQDLQNTINQLQHMLDDNKKSMEQASKATAKLSSTERIIREKLGFVTDQLEGKKVLLSLSDDRTATEEKQKAFMELTKEIAEVSDNLLEEKFGLNARHKDIKVDLAETERTIKKLEANILHLPQNVLLAKEKLEAELLKEGIKTEIRTFAELVEDVTDESFRGALEAFLGKKRYNLIVDGKYSKKTIELVESLKLKGAVIVMTDKLQDSEIRAGSAAELLTIPNQYARKYANYLLNGIHLCQDIDELHEYPLGGMTRSGMLAKSYAVSLMDIKGIEVCLGSKAIELQKKAAENKKKELQAAMQDIKIQLDEVQHKLNAMQSLDTHLDNYRFDAPSLLAETKIKEQELSADIDSYKNNPDFTRYFEEQQKASQEKKKAEQAKDAAIRLIGSLENDISRIGSEIEEKGIRLEECKNTYDERRESSADIALKAEEEYAKQSLMRGSLEVLSKKYVDSLRNDVERAKNAMEDSQINYCRVAGQDTFKRGTAYIPYYRQAYAELSVVKIEEAKNKMKVQEENLQSAFMHDFIGEISEAIRKAQDEIAAINKELKQIPFGQDTYKFITKEKPDRAIFFTICKKLSEYANSPEMYMAMGHDDEEMEHNIAQFMDTILDEEDESEYTDYRRYFTYDMEIIRRLGDEEITADLSKKQGSASNGEKQTPYFIILAASLMQCYPMNACCARLAFIDEAFSALSRERIEQMVKYFESNNFQVIYAAPPEKIASIGQYISTTVSLYPKGQYSFAIEGQYAN